MKEAIIKLIEKWACRHVWTEERETTIQDGWGE